MFLTDETLRFIRQHADDDVRALALHARALPGVDLPAALTQIAGLQTLRAKVPTWAATEGILCPARLSLEQCSSEATARYKADIIAAHAGPRRRLADLTGGLGIDCSLLAPLFTEVDYVERQEELCRLAGHNFPLLGLTHIHVHCADGTAFLAGMPPADWLFLDPARRDSHGGKTVALADCEPDVSQLEERLLEKAPNVLLKLSPMLDLTLALHTLRHVREAHIVAVDNECKELLLVMNARNCCWCWKRTLRPMQTISPSLVSTWEVKNTSRQSFALPAARNRLLPVCWPMFPVLTSTSPTLPC